MSIQNEIDRIKVNVSAAFDAVSDMGGTVPSPAGSQNLAEAIRSIPAGGSSGTPGTVPLGPKAVYQATRPSDWLAMPTPAEDEIYLLFHIPDGMSSLLAFTVTCSGDYTVTVEGTNVQSVFASGVKCEMELYASDFEGLTSSGMRQAMIKISGTDILTWEPSGHSKKPSPSKFAKWNIVEIACNLPSGTKVACGSSTANLALQKLRYFTWIGENMASDMSHMFRYCYALTAIPELDTSQASLMSYMFNSDYSLTAVPEMDTSNVTAMDGMFNSCYALAAVPEMDTSKVTSMVGMFNYCYVLSAVPEMDTSKVTSMASMFARCYALTAVPKLDTSNVTNMANTFTDCHSLSVIRFVPSVTGWAGYAVSLKDCSLSHQAITGLFSSLPAITSAKTLTLTGNPGVSELTAEEKAIAAGKNWNLTL